MNTFQVRAPRIPSGSQAISVSSLRERVRLVTSLAVIAFGHPDGFYGFSRLALALDQVSLRPIHRTENLGDASAGPPASRQRPAARAGSSGKVVMEEISRNALTVNGFCQLATATGRLAQLLHLPRASSDSLEPKNIQASIRGGGGV